MSPRGLRIPPAFVGLALALLAAWAAWLTTGGAGADGQAAGLVLVIVMAAAVGVAIALRSRGGPTGAGRTGASRTGSVAAWTGTPAPSLAPPSRPRGPRSAYPRLKRTGREPAWAPDGVEHARSRSIMRDVPRLMVILGAIGTLVFASAMPGSPSDVPSVEEGYWSYVVASAIVGGLPCALGGLIAGWGYADRTGAALRGILLGVVIGAVIAIALLAPTIDPTRGAAPYVQLGVLLVMAPAATIAFGLGLIVQRGIAALSRLLRPAA